MFKIYFLVIILFSFKIYSQNIKGVIKNDLNEPINANILIKNSENKKIISEFFFTNEKGEYNFQLKKEYHILQIIFFNTFFLPL